MKKLFLRKAAVASACLMLASSFCLTGSALADDSAVIESEHRGAILTLGTIMENHAAGLRADAVQAKKDITGINATGPASAWLQRVAPDHVNMVTNRFEKQTQAEIKFNGKTYRASGSGAAWNISQNPSTSFAKDPMTNKLVDKADAVIYADASGRVFYFESEASYKNFLSLASPETLYGYSEPR